MIDIQRGPTAIRERLGGGLSGASAIRLEVSLDSSPWPQEDLVGIGMMLDVDAL